MKFLAWHRRRARLVLLAALLVAWGCVLWSTGWTAADLLDAQAASMGSGSAPVGTQPAAAKAYSRPGTSR